MIKLLDKSVSELIAAGEVIDRPSSVVKELIENSIDAGSKSITVEIQNGGITYIRISDDGDGIPYDECPTAFLRHATSKVSTGEDLMSILTLGFRGEALASVSAVSRVVLLTKTSSQELGTSYKIECGEELEHTQAGCPDGTTIIIRDLFCNTPARLKFLKKDVTEGNFVQSVVEKAALINPSIAFRFIRDNKLTRVTPGDGKLYSSIYAIYGKSFAQSMVPVEWEQAGISVNGYVSRPIFCRSNRAFQNFYVNTRNVRSSTFVAALEEGYRNSMMTGKFPACVLNLSINPAEVDANVHPTKTEVRFANDRAIFSTIHIAVKNALLNTDTSGEHRPLQSHIGEQSVAFASSKADYSVIKPQTVEPIEIEYKYINPESLIKREKPSIPENVHNSHNAHNILTEENHAQHRIIGELFSTYIVCEQGEDLVLIDKHAADERIRFDRLKSELKTFSQLLIEPVEVGLDVESCGVLLDASEELEQIGLKIEVAYSSDSKVKVVAMPSILGNYETEKLLSSLAESLKNGMPITFDNLEVVDEILHSVACRAAIKAGDRSVSCDISQLAERVLTDSELQYCPHGRPISVRITKRDFEKKFKRII